MNVFIVGAGAVGSAAAYEISRAGYSQVYLYDIDSGLARGRTMDIRQALEYPQAIEHSPDYSHLPGADLIVVTAGSARQKGMTRADLASKNIAIVSSVTEHIAELSPGTPILIVTNPTEALVYHLKHRWPALNVFGFGCSLDQWRYRHFVADALNCSTARVRAMVFGMHNDAMIPLSRLASVDGVPLEAILAAEEIRQIEQQTRTAGTDIVNALGTHSGFVAAGRAIAELVGSFNSEDGGFYPLSLMADGAYGIEDACLALPSHVSRAGIRPIDLALTASELAKLRACAAQVREAVQPTAAGNAGPTDAATGVAAAS